MVKNRAIFIDRDGTINLDVRYLNDPNRLQIHPGVARGIRMLSDRGFKVVVITNQSGIARGYFTRETLYRIHERMMSELAGAGARIDAIYYCPHRPEENCDCRKPRTGMFNKAIRELNIDPCISYTVGDRILDIQAGKSVGCVTVLVPEKGREDEAQRELQNSSIAPDHICADFLSAARWILDHSKDRSTSLLSEIE